ncbi:MAG: MipA/OmpV family protein [Phycisphaerae bacterium]|nr:MipA/OmpV family protein [Phycisphaerae bacterium]
MVLFFAFAAICGVAFGERPLFMENDPNLAVSGQEQGKPSGLQIGGGVLVTGRPYKDIDSRVLGIPFIMYEGKDWSFKGTRFDYKLSEQGPVTFKGLLRLRTEGYDTDDSSALRGMDDREVTLDAGLSLAFKRRWGTVRFEALTDTLGKNNGQELAISISKPIYAPYNLKKLFIAPFAGAEWRTTSLNDYYYGVRVCRDKPDWNRD